MNKFSEVGINARLATRSARSLNPDKYTGNRDSSKEGTKGEGEEPERRGDLIWYHMRICLDLCGCGNPENENNQISDRLFPQ